MKLFLLTISILFSTLTFCQKNKTVFEIDSLLKANPGLENYRYRYGGNDYSVCDFRMDTTTGKLSRFRYTSEGSDTIATDYLFINNYLVKAHSFRKEQNITIGTYYFKDNKVFHKTGKNIKLVGKGYFKKIAPKYFQKQLDYIYLQYEYLNPSKTRFQINVPKLLADKRREIDRRNSY
jgi:hypothetical protein